MSLYPDTISSKAAHAAAEAMSNINHLGALRALCENSLGRGQRMQRLEGRIVALCKAEAQAQLRIMDKAHGRKETP